MISVPEPFPSKPGRTQYKRAVGMLNDSLALICAPVLAYVFRLGAFPALERSFLWFALPFFVAGFFSLLLFGLNRGSWRYASLEDLIAIMKCAVIAVMAGAVGAVIGGSLDGFPRSLLPLSFVTLLVLMAGPRVIYRIFKEKVPSINRRHLSRSEPVLLYGYCDASANFIRQARRQHSLPLNPIGIIAHRESHANRTLYDVPVLGTLADLTAIVERQRDRGRDIGKIIIALPHPPVEEIERIVEAAASLNITTLQIPHFSDFLNADVPSVPQTINIEDLLGRTNINVDTSSISNQFVGKRVMVTGAGGSIGSEICQQVGALGIVHITLADQGEYNLYMVDGDMAQRFPGLSRSAVLCDVRDRAAVDRVMAQEKPDLVFHAAALKHVQLVEANQVEGMRTNIVGTRNVADAALAAGCDAFVMISTDKAVNPSNVMGASKRFAEAYCQLLDRTSARTRFMTVRFGNVLGSAGSVVPLFTRQIAKGGPITVTHPDIERYFMTIPEAVRLVIAACVRGMAAASDRGRILVLDMGKPIRIVDLARRMIQLSGLKPDEDIKIEFIGLRPGEKLYEETFASSEVLLPTYNTWLQVAGYRPVNPDTMSHALDVIEAAIMAGDATLGVSGVKMIVPELVREAEHPADAGKPANITVLPQRQTGIAPG